MPLVWSGVQMLGSVNKLPRNFLGLNAGRCDQEDKLTKFKSNKTTNLDRLVHLICHSLSETTISVPPDHLGQEYPVFHT